MKFILVLLIRITMYRIRTEGATTTLIPFLKKLGFKRVGAARKPERVTDPSATKSTEAEKLNEIPRNGGSPEGAVQSQKAKVRDETLPLPPKRERRSAVPSPKTPDPESKLEMWTEFQTKPGIRDMIRDGRTKFESIRAKMCDG